MALYPKTKQRFYLIKRFQNEIGIWVDTDPISTSESLSLIISAARNYGSRYPDMFGIDPDLWFYYDEPTVNSNKRYVNAKEFINLLDLNKPMFGSGF